MGRVLTQVPPLASLAGWRRIAILIALLAPMVALHIVHAPRQGPFDSDPSYYLQAAKHVAAGEGLLTTVSQYHEGLSPLPQPYHDYPLWPLLLGATGRFVGLFVAANVLPQLFFLAGLILIYILANRLAGDAGRFQIREDVVDVGHLVVLLAGFNFIFFTSTTKPYTEGLAFTLALGSFLFLEKKPAWSGALAGLSVLARYQMVLVPIATVIVLIALRHWKKSVAYAAPVAGIGGAWWIYLQRAGIRRVEIPAWQEWLTQPGLAGKAAHLLKGLFAAVNPLSEVSLFHSFGIVVAVVAIALFFLRRDESPLFWSVLLCGAGSMVVLANFESVRPPEWLFGSRHSLLFIFVVIPSIVAVLTRAPRVLRIAALVLAGVSIAQGAVATFRHPMPSGRGLTGADREMARWLSSNAPDATLLTTNAQALSVYTTNRYHWTNCSVAPATTRVILERLPVDYVVVYDSEKSCAFAQSFSDITTLEVMFSDDVRRVYLFKVIRKMTSTGAPSVPHAAAGL